MYRQKRINHGVMDPKRNFRCIGLREAEGGRLELRETSPRSPTPGLPDPTRLKPQGHTYAAFNVACGVRLASRIPSRRCRCPGVGVGAGAIPAPTSPRNTYRAAGSAGHGEILWNWASIQLLGRHGEDNWVLKQVEGLLTELIDNLYFRPLPKLGGYRVEY